jgi:hypothetical protein
MLDLLYGEGYVKKEFPGKCKQFGRHGIDISSEPMLVYPTLHYQNGGIEFQTTGETAVPGLYVAGEVGGEKAKDGKMSLDHVKAYNKEVVEAGIEGDRVSPMLLPDYTDPRVRERQLTSHYVGTMR